MSIKTVGMVGPGDMGSATGKTLVDHGLDVVVCLENRSKASCERAVASGMRIVPSYDDFVQESELILSILPPSEAVSVAQDIARRIKAFGLETVFVDFNAISPQTTDLINLAVYESGGLFVDGSIIGSPPQPGMHPRFYCSGPDLSVVLELREFGLDVRALGKEIGWASGLKMLYAASTKGTIALWINLLTAALKMGLDKALTEELTKSPVYTLMKNNIPTVPGRSSRWIKEMEEIAETFDSYGLAADFFSGAAKVYLSVAKTQMANQDPMGKTTTFEQTIEQICLAINNP